MPGPTIDNPNLPSDVQPEIRAAWIALSVSVVLTSIKFVAYLLTQSSAIFSDALESIVNVVAGGIMVYAIYEAHRPADREHPYGHGKVEFIAAATEGAMIFLAALVIVFRAIEELIFGPKLEHLGLGIWLIMAAMAVNAAVGWWLVHAGRRDGSIALEADGKHLFTDAITSAAVLVALLLVQWTGRKWVDPVCAIFIAGLIAWIGLRLFRSSSGGLMDEQDLSDDAKIRAIIQSHIGPDAHEPRVCGFHKLRHRHTGRYHWIDFHLIVPASWPVDRAHRAASVIEHEIEQAMRYADATAHIEPCEEESCASECQSAAGSSTSA